VPEEEKQSLWQRFASWFTTKPEREEPAAEAEVTEDTESAEAAVEEEGGELPRAVLGWALAFLTVALGVTIYFVVRKEVIERRLEKYL